MRVLGIEIAGSDTLVVVLKGTADDCSIELLTQSRLQCPASGEEVDRLIAFRRQMHDLLQSKSVEIVAIVRADRSSSVIRAKLECMIQLASHDRNTPCMLVAAQTVSAAEKRKVEHVAGVEVARSLRGIRPAYLKKAIHCAWSCMHERQR